MSTCELCQEQLLHYVYGVLEESEIQDVREHLSTCSSCQAALAAAQADQKKLALAARAVTSVPELTLPAHQPSEVSPNAPTMPLIVPPTPKRSSWRRPWVAWSTAAAVLLALGTSVGMHHRELHARQQLFTTAQGRLKNLDTQLAALPAECQAEMTAALHTVRKQSGPYLHVVGPTTLQPHAKAPIQIATRGLEGEPLAGTIRVKLVEPDTGNVLFLSRFDSEGQTRGEIDTSNAMPNTTLHLVVEADTPNGLARMQETLRVPAPSYVTRLDTNKAVYQVTDIVFFRALVLNRYSLTPPGEPIAMRAQLMNPAGQTAAYVDLHTGASGILAGELPITENFATGSYTLKVTATKASQVQTAAQTIEIVRDLPDIRLNQARYAKGDMIIGDVTLPRALAGEAKAKVTLGNGKAVDVTLRAQPEAAAAPALGGKGGGGITNAAKAKGAKPKDEGQVFRFQMVIPDNLSANENGVPLLLEFKDVRRNAFVPLEPTEFTIDFFPEGGDLIEGVKNRVFYRVRSTAGEPVTGDGRVILLTGKNEIVDTHYKLGLGYLDFTPDSKETYTVRITTPMKLAEIANPFARPGIRKDGVVLHVPRAVGKEGDAIRLVLRQKAESRKLVLLAHCRGQIVDERTIELKTGTTSVTLHPGSDAFGMIRVTAYEVVGNELLPLAERLVYRAPARRLDLGFALGTPQLQPGLQNLKAKIHAADEKGQPASAWILASVVDERFQPRPQSLAAHFLLLNEVRSGADIDNAQLFLNDNAESTQVLERFLGTHGWRRFVPAQESPLVALPKADAKQPPLLFSRENASMAAIQAKYQAQRIAALRPVHEIALRKETELNAERASLAITVVDAQRAVFAFEEDVQYAIRLGLGIAMALLLLASMALMALGLYRLARAHRIATPAFGSAFAGLAACLVIYVVGKSLGTLEIRIPSNEQHAAASDVNNLLQKFLAPVPQHPFVPDGPINDGVLAARPAKSMEREAQGFAAEAKAADAVGFGAAAGRGGAPSEQSLNALALRNRSDGAALPMNRQPPTARFEEARSQTTFPPQAAAGPGGSGKGNVKPSAAPPTIQAAPAPAVPAARLHKMDADRAGRRVEYAYEYVPNMPADTLLWHPNLWLEQGNAEVHFDIPSGQASYRVLLFGHGPSGRFGFLETRLDVPAVAGR